jgi:16S rRNA (uracil1498-N3)-methyltransferase
MERIEWFIEKATEIGIHEISLLRCINSERKTMKADRISRKLINAAKQSLRTHFPVLNEITSFSGFLSKSTADEKFIAYMDEAGIPPLHRAASPEKRYIVMIGPEGDFSQSEILTSRKAGYLPVNLGHHRLRTETAGIVACQMLRDLHLR